MTPNPPRWSWRAEGFQCEPAKVVARRTLKVYRVWGGTASELGHPARPGVCFSFDVPRSRRDAEKLFAVWEWGNTCANITPFEVAAGATLFVGKAHPGDAYQSGLGAPGSQVFIEMSEVRHRVRKLGAAMPLANDMGVHLVIPNRDPGRSRSS